MRGFLKIFIFFGLLKIITSSTILILTDNDENLYKSIQDVSDRAIADGNYNKLLYKVKDYDYTTVENLCKIIDNDNISLILDFSPPNLSSVIQDIDIPIVSFTFPYFRKKDKESIIYLDRPSYSFIQIIRDIVIAENLTNIGIVYDETFNFDDLPKILLSDTNCRHFFIKFSLFALNILRKAEVMHIFVVTNDNSAEMLLKEAENYGLSEAKYNWYIISLTFRVCLNCTDFVHILRINPTEKVNYINFDNYNQLFVDDILKKSTSVLKEIDMNGVRYGSCTINPNYEGRLMLNNFNKLFDKKLDNGNLKLTKDSINTYRYDLTLNISTSQIAVATWERFKGFVTKNSLLSRSPKIIYKIATVEFPPFVFKSKEKPTSVKYLHYNRENGYYFYGYCIDLIEEIRIRMNFDYFLYEPEDGKFGSLQANDSWNGLVKEILDENADIIVTAFSVMSERETVIDYTTPYYDPVGMTVMIRNPGFEYSITKFLNVLEGSVWGCILTAFVIVSVFLCLFDHYSPFSYQNNRKAYKDEKRIFTIQEGFWFCLTSLTPQGGGEAPRALSGRLVAATWWIFGFIVVSTYTANLAAFLTVSRLDEPISSIDDLAGQFKVKYATLSSGASKSYFERMRDIESRFYDIWTRMSLDLKLSEYERSRLAVWDYPLSDKYTNMWSAMEKSKFPENFKEAIDRIKNRPGDEDFAFIGDATMIKYAALTDCKLWQVGEEFSKKPYALGVAKGSKLQNRLSSVILELSQLRILEELKVNWWNFGKVKCSKSSDESQGISIKNIGGVFLVVGLGYISGWIAFGIEFYWFGYRKRKAPIGNHS